LATIRPGGQHITARGNKDFRSQMGSMLGFSADAGRCYLFDTHTQNRLRVSSS
jgi:hypothetical protein